MDLHTIKADLYALIEKQSNPEILDALKTLLEEIELNPILKEKLSNRAIKAEQDIKSGRIYNLDEFKKHLNVRM